MEHNEHIRPYLGLCPQHHRHKLGNSLIKMCRVSCEVVVHTIPSLLGNTQLEILIPGRQDSQERWETGSAFPNTSCSLSWPGSRMRDKMQHTHKKNSKEDKEAKNQNKQTACRDGVALWIQSLSCFYLKNQELL